MTSKNEIHTVVKNWLADRGYFVTDTSKSIIPIPPLCFEGLLWSLLVSESEGGNSVYLLVKADGASHTADVLYEKSYDSETNAIVQVATLELANPRFFDLLVAALDSAFISVN